MPKNRKITVSLTANIKLAEYNSTTNGEHFEAAAINRHLPLYPFFLQDLLNAYGKSLKHCHLLELGCGPGFMLELFSKSEALSVTGVDISNDMLERAAKRCGRAKLVQADVKHMPFPDNFFNIVFSRGSVFFWNPIESAFKEIRRVAAQGALIFIGGGYGISTPEEIVSQVRQIRSKEEKHSIPRLIPQSLAEIAETYGDKAEIISAKGRGFWLKWLKS